MSSSNRLDNEEAKAAAAAAISNNTSEPGSFVPPVSLPKPKRKMSFDDMYDRDTVYIERELKTFIESIKDVGKRGTKTRIINEALKIYLSDIENVKKHLTEEQLEALYGAVE